MNPVNGPVLVVLLLAVVVLVALWRSEAMSARLWRQRAEQLDTPIDLWPVSNVTVTDDWPPAVREYVAGIPTFSQAEWSRATSEHLAMEAAARDRHPVGKGLRAVGGGDRG